LYFFLVVVCPPIQADALLDFCQAHDVRKEPDFLHDLRANLIGANRRLSLLVCAPLLLITAISILPQILAWKVAQQKDGKNTTSA
jgi:hypothetical protein